MFKIIIKPIALAMVTAVAAGCATNNGYQKAFSADSAIQGNHQTFPAAKVTLVRQGFTIEQADINSGLVKAVRNFQDPVDQTVSYNIIATADVTADDENSVVTLAASQQTVLHREWHEWWHLLWIIPLFPVSTEYQTVVTHEGNVTDPVFYKDFFASIGSTLVSNAAVSRAKAAKAAVSVEPPVAVVASPEVNGDTQAAPAVTDTATPAPTTPAVPAVAVEAAAPPITPPVEAAAAPASASVLDPTPTPAPAPAPVAAP